MLDHIFLFSYLPISFSLFIGFYNILSNSSFSPFIFLFFGNPFVHHIDGSCHVLSPFYAHLPFCLPLYRIFIHLFWLFFFPSAILLHPYFYVTYLHVSVFFSCTLICILKEKFHFYNFLSSFADLSISFLSLMISPSLYSSFLSLFPICVHLLRPVAGSELHRNIIYVGLVLCV